MKTTSAYITNKRECESSPKFKLGSLWIASGSNSIIICTKSSNDCLYGATICSSVYELGDTNNNMAWSDTYFTPFYGTVTITQE